MNSCVAIWSGPDPAEVTRNAGFFNESFQHFKPGSKNKTENIDAHLKLIGIFEVTMRSSLLGPKIAPGSPWAGPDKLKIWEIWPMTPPPKSDYELLRGGGSDAPNPVNYSVLEGSRGVPCEGPKMAQIWGARNRSPLTHTIRRGVRCQSRHAPWCSALRIIWPWTQRPASPVSLAWVLCLPYWESSAQRCKDWKLLYMFWLYVIDYSVHSVFTIIVFDSHYFMLELLFSKISK